MRILEVVPVFSASFGGPVTAVRSISKELARNNEVTIYTTSALDQRRDLKNRPFKIRSEGYQVVYFPRILTISGFNISPSMAQAIREELNEYDIVHLHSFRHFQDIIVHRYAREYDVPYVLQTHGSVPRIVAKQRLKWLYDKFFGYKLLRDSSKVVALTRTEAQQYRNVGVPDKKISIIPNGVDLSAYADLPQNGDFKAKYGISRDRTIILYLGRLHRIKGIDLLLAAYKKLVEEMRTNALLVIAGPDDGYLNTLKSLINQLKLEHNVLLTGPLYDRNKLEAYVDAEVYILPSRYEIFGNTILEAYACSKPVIASDVQSISDIVLNGKTGLLFKAGDVQELVRTLAFVITHPEEAGKMGREGHEFLKDTFLIENISRSLETLYQEVLEERRVIR